MQVKDVMSTDCDWIDPQATLSEAATLMKDKDIGFLAIGEGDRLVGAITDRDIVTRALASNADPNVTAVKDIMTPKVMYCYDDQDTDEICSNMSDVKVRRLPVVNRDKRLVGTISLGDLSQANENESGQALKCITNCA